MIRVCSPWLFTFNSDIQIVTGYNFFHLITAYHILIVLSKLLLIHNLQLLATNAMVKLSDFLYVLQNNLFAHVFLHKRILVLIISLTAFAKQSAEKAHGLTFNLLCCKLFYCLAPDFFLIWILKVSSVTSIIMSLA